MILAIDLGSTSFKASVFDASLECVGEGSSELVYHHGPHGVMQLDPGHLRETLRSAVAQALSAADVTALGAVAVTSQAQTFTVCSPEGVERVPFISWLDSGCAEYNPAADALPEFARHCSVEQCMPSLMVAKLAYLQEQSEGTFVGADDTVLMLPAWVVRQMTGTAAVDKNLAAMCCLYSLLEDDWWSEALRACRIGEHNLPALKELGAVAGNTGQGAAAFGLPTGIPVVLAGNDQTAGAYGIDVHRKNAVLITLGTAQVAYDV
ncbi:MAG: hypothetical protein K9N51_11295, partial [Candidatus Pacebacteria bacterium]|nr:hypothetical protein [Candidatus Paceibacterota bacterium]